jgi:hypothetical protein
MRQAAPLFVKAKSGRFGHFFVYEHCYLAGQADKSETSGVVCRVSAYG